MKSIVTPFSIVGGKVATTTDDNTIARQKIFDVLVTTPGERVMRPTYGAGVYRLLFEPNDELLFSDFKTDALMDISENVSGVTVRDLAIEDSGVNGFPDNTTLLVTAFYQLPYSAAQQATVTVGEPPVLDESEFL